MKILFLQLLKISLYAAAACIKDYPNFPHEAKGSSIDRVYCRKINEGAGPITITYIYNYIICVPTFNSNNEFIL